MTDAAGIFSGGYSSYASCAVKKDGSAVCWGNNSINQLLGYEDADITSLPMTIQPLNNARNAELQLQVMLTKGESVKGKSQEGMLGSYFERKVKLAVK